jgi:hypothetical protein
MTTGAAIVFMFTSMTLALVASSGSSSVLESDPGAAPPAASAPAVATPPALPAQGDAAAIEGDGGLPAEMPQDGSGEAGGDPDTP